MKKVLSIAAVAVFVFGMSSCKKDYTCECTVLGQTASQPLGKLKKKDAEDQCNALGAGAIALGGTCSVKS